MFALYVYCFCDRKTYTLIHQSMVKLHENIRVLELKSSTNVGVLIDSKTCLRSRIHFIFLFL